MSALLCGHAASGASSPATCTAASEFQPRLCKSNLPSITSIRFSPAVAASGEARRECKGFRLSAAQVRRFFRAARTVDANDAHHTLDWSPCHVAGQLRLSDGRTAQWQISQYQTGSMSIEGETMSMSLYCPSCKFTPFRW